MKPARKGVSAKVRAVVVVAVAAGGGVGAARLLGARSRQSSIVSPRSRPGLVGAAWKPGTVRTWETRGTLRCAVTRPTFCSPLRSASVVKHGSHSFQRLARGYP